MWRGILSWIYSFQAGQFFLLNMLFACALRDKHLITAAAVIIINWRLPLLPTQTLYSEVIVQSISLLPYISTTNIIYISWQGHPKLTALHHVNIAVYRDSEPCPSGRCSTCLGSGSYFGVWSVPFSHEATPRTRKTSQSSLRSGRLIPSLYR